MRAMIAAIADDYTGASDLANTWRRCGLRTVQTIGLPHAAVDLSEFDAIVVSLKTRSVASADAVADALAAEAWLRDEGVAHVTYKICSTFDSTDEGNIGPVTDALRGRAGAAWTLITPAFPETGRTVYQGHLFVYGVPLAESPLKDHPLNPMRDSNLVRVLARQSEAEPGLVDLVTVRLGREAVLARIGELVDRGIRSVVADAVSEEDLVALGAVALRSAVSTGASGLGLGLARAVATSLDSIRLSGSVGGAEPLGGMSAVLVGSCSARTAEQVTKAEKTMPVLRLDADRLIASGGDVDEALGWALARLGDGPVLITAASPPDRVAQVQGRYGRHEAGRAIEGAIATIAERLADAGVRRLVVAGGETSGAVVDRLGISTFEVGAEIAPGVPALRTIGRSGCELSMTLKSGNFGAVDFFQDALSAI